LRSKELTKISTVIAKPTKFCSAQCTYCAAPPEVNGAPKWTFEQFRGYFDKLAPHLSPSAVIIWHGGEPMLMGPSFYERAFDYARGLVPGIGFSMQTNLLAYDTAKWQGVFRDVFGGSVSTSYDPDERNRLLGGKAETYARVFWERLERCLDDGFRPKVIGTYTEDSARLAMGFYERLRGYGERAPDMRVNYRYPAGREHGAGELISPETYGRVLVEIYDRWISDLPPFVVTPLDQMMEKVLRLNEHRCPWTNGCAGHFLGLEPDGTAYNCPEFADLALAEFAFGNLGDDDVETLMASKAARDARRRRVFLPDSCRACPHFAECQGGCMRDSILYDKGYGGKFHYCRSWEAVFSRIKASIASGAADGAVRRYGLEPDRVRALLEAGGA
jgi:radical SAM protein with 4Fe4S-binding SPASM domain